MLRRATSWLYRTVADSRMFRRAEPLRSASQAILWWERRRILFNVLVGAAGAASIVLFLIAVVAGDLFFGTKHDYGLLDLPVFGAVFAIVGVYGIMANLCYTAGWIVELVGQKLWKRHADKIAGISFLTGLGFSIFLTLLPGTLVLVSVPSKAGSYLLYAVEKGDEPGVRAILLKYPKSIDFRSGDELDRTPLCIAAEEGNDAIAGILLSAGADANAECYDETPLSSAARRGNLSLVRLLVAHGARVGRESVHPLKEAIEAGHLEMVKFLLDHEAGVNSTEIWGRGISGGRILRTPLRTAAELGRLEIMKLLLERGARVDLQGPNDDSVLHAAVLGGFGKEEHAKAIEMLVAHGAGITSRGFGGKTPLHLSAQGRLVHDPVKKENYYLPVDPAISQYLLDHGANINELDADGHTPLFYAQDAKHGEIAALLRRRGAVLK